jgi:hypothetical protein
VSDWHPDSSRSRKLIVLRHAMILCIMTARTRTRGVRVHRDRGPRPPLRWHRRGGRAPPAWHRCGWQVRLRLRPLPVPAAASASASLSARLSPATRRTLNSESRQRLARQTLIPHAPACASGSGAAELACHRDAAGISGAGFRRSFKLRVGAAFTIHSILSESLSPSHARCGWWSPRAAAREARDRDQGTTRRIGSG